MKYITKNCLFCEGDECNIDLYPKTFSDENIDPLVFSARRVSEHYHYRIVRCKKTGLIFSKEILTDEDLSKLYADSKVIFNKYNQIIGKDYYNPLKKYGDRVKKQYVLDIGCSNGFFLDELFNNGYENIYGCEPSIEAKEMASEKIRENIHTGFFTEELYTDNYFNLICCFQTLDHLSEPLNFLKICHKKIKKDGAIYIIVHNTNALQYKIFKEKSPIIDVEHIYLFNPDNISLLMEKAGFTGIKVFPVKNSYPLEYWIEHSPIPLKNTVLKISKFIRINNLRLSLNFGNMGILAFKK